MANPILENALMFYGIKAIILVIVYSALISPGLPNMSAFQQSVINITYAIISLFVIFGMKSLDALGIALRK